MTISRATLIATADDSDNRVMARTWLEKHKSSLVFVSDNLGCGCCVDIWNIEGDATVVASIPSILLASSAWADGNEA
jgi:hypothetical protein